MDVARADAQFLHVQGKGWPFPGGRTAGRLLLVLAPILALTALTVVLALGAWLLARNEMLVAAAGSGLALALFAMASLYWQVRQRQSAQRSWGNVEARMGDIVEAAMDPIITVDEQQTILVFNAAAEKVFAWPRAEMIGQPLSRLIPGRFHEQHREHIARFGATGATARRMGGPAVLTALRATGDEFPIEASISQHSEDGRKRFTVILRDVTERVRAEQALRQSKEELRQLGEAAHQAREQEKSRISRELHDELGQALTSLQMDVAWFRQRTPEGEAALTAKLDRMESLLDTTVAATRRIAADLRPLMLDDLGLLPAVEWLIDVFTQRTGVECELKLSDGELNITDSQASAVFRTIQESLNNVAKHAHASRVEIRIDRHAGGLNVSVHDDGVGFALQGARKLNSFGLLGLRERASMLGGEANVTSTPGKGTRVLVSFPSEGQAAAP